MLTIGFPALLWGQETFPPAAGQPGSTAIAADSSLISGWVNSGTVYRGWLDRGQKNLGRATQGDSLAFTGAANGQTVSLGDSGYAEIYCNPPLQNQPGADFAVFENSFSDTYLELAFVEVSSNGRDFGRFPAVSLTDSSTQVGTFGSSNPRNIHQLAGKYRGNFGVPFNLDSLPQGTVNKDSITVIRIVDVTGAVGKPYTTRDSRGNPVNDPYPTAFAGGGFDLDAVAFLHPQGIGLTPVKQQEVSVFPLPAKDILHFSTPLARLKMVNLTGEVVLRHAPAARQLSVAQLPKGHYWLTAHNNKQQNISLRIVIR